MYPCAKVALSLESSNVRIFFDDVHVIYVCLFFQALICSRFLECIYWKYHYYQHPAYHGTPNSQGMMYWCLCISLQFYILPWIYPHGSISLWWQIMVFTYPVTPQLLIPNGQGLRLSTFWLSLRWEQKENHINNRSVEKNVGWTHLFAVGGWKLIVFLKWRSSFLLCFFGWAGLHGYTLFDGWYRYGIDGANWQKTYCNFLEVFFCFVLRKGCFWTDTHLANHRWICGFLMPGKGGTKDQRPILVPLLGSFLLHSWSFPRCCFCGSSLVDQTWVRRRDEKID